MQVVINDCIKVKNVICLCAAAMAMRWWSWTTASVRFWSGCELLVLTIIPLSSSPQTTVQLLCLAPMKVGNYFIKKVLFFYLILTRFCVPCDWCRCFCGFWLLRWQQRTLPLWEGDHLWGRHEGACHCLVAWAHQRRLSKKAPVIRAFTK